MTAASRINHDLPLAPENALAHDKLDRQGYAQQVLAGLRTQPETDSLVVAIEGAWGSGKTSTLALIEALLRQEAAHKKSPLIVHFNPWLIGEKDELLRRFFSNVAKAIRTADSSINTSSFAETIDAYAYAFESLKLLPGAEPWASLMKFVFALMGKDDLQTHREKAQKALRDLGRPIIVFIDDIDRLYPAEVYEVLRLVKAVGDLPYIRYVLAWDSAYISSALDKSGVPFPSSYLDKIVQLRMPMPVLSLLAKERFFLDAVHQLSDNTLDTSSMRQQRISALFDHSGLRNLLEQPRDFVRVFNAVKIHEPLLRGEIALADIIGLYALAVKAPGVFHLIQQTPYFFTGYSFADHGVIEKTILDGISPRYEQEIQTLRHAGATRQLIQFLFPNFGHTTMDPIQNEKDYAAGLICEPRRLSYCLQLQLAPSDTSLKMTLRYLTEPESRNEIAAQLQVDSCHAFILQLGELGKITALPKQNCASLCLDIARLTETPLFIESETSKHHFWGLDESALHTVQTLAKSGGADLAALIKTIACDPIALSCAARILLQSYVWDRGRDSEFIQLSMDDKPQVVDTFAANVLAAIQKDGLLQKSRNGVIFFALAKMSPGSCPAVFQTLKQANHGLDGFAVAFLSPNSINGRRVFALHEAIDQLEAYCPLATFQEIARSRLADSLLGYPARAAWMSVLEQKRFYGNGQECND